ncbi:MAG: hypothetical protein ACI9TH_000082 [Kiritimatiellia bacterium]|jgi:hypothetical protein
MNKCLFSVLLTCFATTGFVRGSLIDVIGNPIITSDPAVTVIGLGGANARVFVSKTHTFGGADVPNSVLRTVNGGLTSSSLLAITGWRWSGNDPAANAPDPIDGHIPAVTPLLLKRNGASYDIVGIGTSRTQDNRSITLANGEIATLYPFGLTAGQNKFENDGSFFFGWWNGDTASSSNVSILPHFNHTGLTGTVEQFGTYLSVSAGQSIGTLSQVANSRYSFSVEYDEFMAIPEPQSFGLMVLGLGVVFGLRRCRDLCL